MFDFNVTLYRDSLSTPWGIRLEGGVDFNTPLAIQRVFTGSPASGELQRGDVILSIQHRDTSHMFHQEANDIIKNSGGSIHLTIRRGYAYPGSTMPSYRPQQQTSNSYLSPKAMTKTVNYSPFTPSHLFEAEDPLTSYIRSRPIEKVKNPKPILSQTGSPIMPGETPSLNMRSSVKRYRPASTLPLLTKASQVNYSYNQAAYQPHNNPPQSYPNYTNLNTVPVPFNDKRMASQIQQSLHRAVNSRPAPLNIATSTTTYPGYYNQPAPVYSPTLYSNQNNSPPPWKNINNKGNVHSYYDFQQQQQQQQQPAHHQHYQQQQQPQYQVPPSQSFHVGTIANQPKSPKVVNLKYNTPIGLYSKDNIKEELYKQVGSSHDIQFVPSSEF